MNVKSKKEPQKHKSMDYEFVIYYVTSAVKLLIGSIIVAVFLCIMKAPVVFPVLSIFAVTLPIIAAIKYVKNALQNFRKYCAENNIDYAEIEQEWEKSIAYCSQGSVVAMGDKHLILHTGAYKWKNILWIYDTVINVENFRGGKMPTEHLRVCLDNGSTIDIVFPLMDAIVFMNDVKKAHPEIVVGYDPKLNVMYHNHIEKFKSCAHSLQDRTSGDY